MKVNRTILFSTHLMEEADALADQIIILANGKIRANDTSEQLKLKYGNGLKLILHFNEEIEQSDLIERIEKCCPNCQIENERNNQLIVQTNEQSEELFLQLLNEIDRLKEKNFIRNSSLANPTLGIRAILLFQCKISFLLSDEIYLRILNEEEEEEEDIEEDCYEIFVDQCVEKGWEIYLSQYEGLLIKSLNIAWRKKSILIFILLVPLFIQHYLKQNPNNSPIIYSFDDWSHLKEQKIIIASNQIFQKDVLNEYPSNIDWIFLSNLSDARQLNDLLWSRREWIFLQKRNGIV